MPFLYYSKILPTAGDYAETIGKELPSQRDAIVICVDMVSSADCKKTPCAITFMQSLLASERELRIES